MKIRNNSTINWLGKANMRKFKPSHPNKMCNSIIELKKLYQSGQYKIQYEAIAQSIVQCLNKTHSQKSKNF